MLDDRDYMRQPEYRDPMFSGFRWSWTMVLIAVNLAVFVLMEINKAYNPDGFLKIFQTCALSNDGVLHGYVWQYLTFQFLHAGGGHFAGNMISLFFLGRLVEDRIGGKRMLLMYLASGAAGGVLQTVLGFVFPSVFGGPVVGASAGVCGLLAAFAAMEPDGQVLLFYMIPVRVKYLAFAAAVVALFYTVVPAAPGYAHAAHLGGMLMSWLFIRRIFPADWSKLTGTLRRAEKKQPRRPQAEPLEPKSDTDFLQNQVDAILDKISAHGIQSLTTREREILESARKKMTKS
ncbi:MAG TPA: rhomboid family intramembrane serine protease [Candidatus Acidoferrales bacterium]|jgi:membrane associated rhomboid family serine protease|nr:rhomboid family intramembrane serine protease [Candidatus Acidoferrales bacterium]